MSLDARFITRRQMRVCCACVPCYPPHYHPLAAHMLSIPMLGYFPVKLLAPGSPYNAKCACVHALSGAMHAHPTTPLRH